VSTKEREIQTLWPMGHNTPHSGLPDLEALKP
jgi:hypothetical protein